MNHGRLRELEWQRDDLWRQMNELDWRANWEQWKTLRRAYQEATDELLRAL